VKFDVQYTISMLMSQTRSPGWHAVQKTIFSASDCPNMRNHQARCDDALRQLRISDDKTQYFNSGMIPAVAMSLHESKLMLSYC